MLIVLHNMNVYMKGVIIINYRNLKICTVILLLREICDREMHLYFVNYHN